MTRFITLPLVLLSLISSPVLADGNVEYVIADQSADPPPKPPKAGAKDTAPAGKADKPKAEEAKPEGATAIGFHEVCDCCDRIEYQLGCNCDCRDQSCFTDEWCENPCTCSHGNCYRSADGCWLSNGGYCDVSGEEPSDTTGAIRFGYWGTKNTGSQQKTGEFQSLSPSVFWDVDTVISDGTRTLDIVASQLNGDSYDARIQYYGPGMRANIKYEEFSHRLEHDTLTGFDLNGPTPPTLANNVVSKDLNVGKEYAIRVEQLDAKFKGDLTENIKWKINVWEQRKFGDRQVNATAHCYNVGPVTPSSAQNNTCHVLSQSQRIDWTTSEFTPGIEGRWEFGTVEYARTMRVFGQQDQIVDRNYTRFGYSATSGATGPDYLYALVPETVTQIDRFKLSTRFNKDTSLYANAYVGDTHNEFRDTHRQSDGYDIRLTNTSCRDFTWTIYTNLDDETNQLPTTLLTSAPYSPPITGTNQVDSNSLLHPVDYHRQRAGVKTNWQPFGRPAEGGASEGLWDGLSITGGYEYYLIDRTFATYNTSLGPFTQPETISHKLELGPSIKWSTELQTYVRYKGAFYNEPLIGVRPSSLPSGVFNTNQPEQEQGAEIGGTWMPIANFMATAQLGLTHSWNHSQYANFNETDYPLTLTTWYAPNECLSFTFGYAHFNNGIDQNITLGFAAPNSETTRWNYLGENHLVSVSANYKWSRNLSFLAGFEYDRGTDTFAVPASPAGANWSLLPSLSNETIETHRITAGANWRPYEHLNGYARYIYYGYNDLNDATVSGKSHMVLLGGDWIF